MAAGDLPPHVASAELITSAWGNAVVDAATFERTNGIDVSWDLPQVSATSAGTFDLAPGLPNTTLPYPTRMTIVMSLYHGFSSTPGVGRVDLYRYKDGAIGSGPDIQNPASYWVCTPVSWSYDVAAGAQWGARARVTITTPGGTYWVRGSGFYRLQRTT